MCASGKCTRGSFRLWFLNGCCRDTATGRIRWMMVVHRIAGSMASYVSRPGFACFPCQHPPMQWASILTCDTGPPPRPPCPIYLISSRMACHWELIHRSDCRARFKPLSTSPSPVPRCSGLAYTDTNGMHPSPAMLAPIREYCRSLTRLQRSDALWESLTDFYITRVSITCMLISLRSSPISIGKRRRRHPEFVLPFIYTG